jgi:hypothetical protein
MRSWMAAMISGVVEASSSPTSTSVGAAKSASLPLTSRPLNDRHAAAQSTAVLCSTRSRA